MLPGLIVGYANEKRDRGYMSRNIGRFVMLFIASGGAVLLLLKSI